MPHCCAAFNSDNFISGFQRLAIIYILPRRYFSVFILLILIFINVFIYIFFISIITKITGRALDLIEKHVNYLVNILRNQFSDINSLYIWCIPWSPVNIQSKSDFSTITSFIKENILFQNKSIIIRSAKHLLC